MRAWPEKFGTWEPGHRGCSAVNEVWQWRFIGGWSGVNGSTSLRWCSVLSALPGASQRPIDPAAVLRPCVIGYARRQGSLMSVPVSVQRVVGRG